MRQRGEGERTGIEAVLAGKGKGVGVVKGEGVQEGGLLLLLFLKSPLERIESGHQKLNAFLQQGVYVAST